MDNIENLNENEKVNTCHLPKTDFCLLSEKEKFIKHNNNGHLKKAFTSMFKAEGFGRGTSSKGGKYGTIEFKPKWYNDDLNYKCSWEHQKTGLVFGHTSCTTSSWLATSTNFQLMSLIRSIKPMRTLTNFMRLG